jgi:hypothetical protein
MHGVSIFFNVFEGLKEVKKAKRCRMKKKKKKKIPSLL